MLIKSEAIEWNPIWFSLVLINLPYMCVGGEYHVTWIICMNSLPSATVQLNFNYIMCLEFTNN